MRMVVSMVGLPVWLCAGKVVRIPLARPLAMKARRDSLVSIVGIGDLLLGPGLSIGRSGRPPPFNIKSNWKGQTDRCAANKLFADSYYSPFAAQKVPKLNF